ncbi:hypothetical protein GCM10028799_31490 [Kribbella italica]
MDEGDQGAVYQDERQYQGSAQEEVDPAQVRRPAEQHVRHVVILSKTRAVVLPPAGEAGPPEEGERLHDLGHRQ